MDKKYQFRKVKLNFYGRIPSKLSIKELQDAPEEYIQKIVSKYPEIIVENRQSIYIEPTSYNYTFAIQPLYENKVEYDNLLLNTTYTIFSDKRIAHLKEMEDGEEIFEKFTGINFEIYDKLRKTMNEAGTEGTLKSLTTVNAIKNGISEGKSFKWLFEKIMGEYSQENLDKLVEIYTAGEFKTFDEWRPVIPANEKLGTPAVRVITYCYK